ncbi:MAG: isopenicillin N synthase family oxygenase [Comamonadaceae bacterium]|nr:MAG: isopenicillin N synthase family oxygenase [Comamonadaceae bacterium]
MAGLHVPVVDLSPLRGGDAAARAAAARAFGDAFEHTGFVTVVNHGVPDALVHDTYRAAHGFFALPMQDKTRHTPPEQTKGRGYLPLGIESVAATLAGKTAPDLCEALVFASLQREAAGLGAPNFWPGQPAQLAPLVRQWFDAMLALCRTLMRMSALALDLPEQHFDAAFTEPSLTLRFVHYPDQPQPPAPGQLRYGAHHDYGGLTILRQDDAPGGLQVADSAGRWHDVPPLPGSFVINAGDLMARWTNGRWRSTLHRVMNPGRELTGSTSRLSMVAFTGPHPSTLVDALPTCIGSGLPVPDGPVEAGAYIQSKIAASHAL